MSRIAPRCGGSRLAATPRHEYRLRHVGFNEKALDARSTTAGSAARFPRADTHGDGNDDTSGSRGGAVGPSLSRQRYGSEQQRPGRRRHTGDRRLPGHRSVSNRSTEASQTGPPGGESSEAREIRGRREDRGLPARVGASGEGVRGGLLRGDFKGRTRLPTPDLLQARSCSRQNTFPFDGRGCAKRGSGPEKRSGPARSRITSRGRGRATWSSDLSRPRRYGRT